MSKSVFPGILFFFCQNWPSLKISWFFWQNNFFNKQSTGTGNYAIFNKAIYALRKLLHGLSTRFARSFTGYLRASRALSRAIYALLALFHKALYISFFARYDIWFSIRFDICLYALRALWYFTFYALCALSYMTFYALRTFWYKFLKRCQITISGTSWSVFWHYRHQ